MKGRRPRQVSRVATGFVRTVDEAIALLALIATPTSRC